jgi:glutamine synthetase
LIDTHLKAIRSARAQTAAVDSGPAPLETPASRMALKALEADHAYLLKGNVFSQDLIDAWISYKYEREVQVNRLRPTPMEFELYYDC